MGLLYPDRLSAAEQQTIIENQKAWILSRCSPLALILFGSAALGTMNTSSDIDIALVFPDSDTLKRARSLLYVDPPPKNIWPADLLFFTPAGFHRGLERGGVCELIRHEGIVLHGRWP